MGRPKKPIQRRANGIYVVQMWVDGKRVVRSLQTRDLVTAHKRAAQAMAEIEQEAKRKQQGLTKWKEPAVFRDLLTSTVDQLGYDLTPQDVAEQFTGSRAVDEETGEFLDKNTQALADALYKRQVPISWQDLVREAEAVRQRKKLGPYSDSWHRNVRIALKQVPFTLDQVSPEAIRGWMQELQKDGASGLTIASKCSLLSGLVTTCIKSGLLAGRTNPFDLVDYAAGEADHIYTAVESDYRGLVSLIPELLDRQLIPILIQAYCGTRISEVIKRKREDFDLEAGTMQIYLAKNKSSERTIPLPSHVVELLKEFDFDGWGSLAHINKRLKQVNPELSSHSFRHGLTNLGRDLQIHPDPIEAMLGHALGGQKSTYGDGYSPEALRKAVTPAWKQLDQWIK